MEQSTKKKISAKDIDGFLDGYEWTDDEKVIVKEIKDRCFTPFRFKRTCDNAECQMNMMGFCAMKHHDCEYKLNKEKDEKTGFEYEHVLAERDEERLNKIAELKVMLVHYKKWLDATKKQRDKVADYAKQCEKEALAIKEELERIRGEYDKERGENSVYNQLAQEWFNYFGMRTPKEVVRRLEQLENEKKSMDGQSGTISNMQKQINNLTTLLNEKTEQCLQLRARVKELTKE